MTDLCAALAAGPAQRDAAIVAAVSLAERSWRDYSFPGASANAREMAREQFIVRAIRLIDARRLRPDRNPDAYVRRLAYLSMLQAMRGEARRHQRQQRYAAEHDGERARRNFAADIMAHHVTRRAAMLAGKARR